MLVGDFNSNTIWDKPRREGNHSTVVDFLKQKASIALITNFLNKNKDRKNITLYSCTGTKTNHIILIIVLRQKILLKNYPV